MKRKIAIILAVVLLLSTGIVYAASVNGTFAGLPIVNVIVNGEAVKSDVPGVVLQGKTLLPARAIAESLDSSVSWDQATMTATITRPEVNMVLVDEAKLDSNDSWVLTNPFGIINTGYYTVNVFYEVCPMEKQLCEYRIALVDPDGDTVSMESDSFEISEYGLSGTLVFDQVNFTKTGNYHFEFQIKLNNEYQTVARKTLIVE